MTTSYVSTTKGLNHQQVATLIVSCPGIRVHVEGEQGTGKSSLLDTVQRMSGIKRAAYIDVPRFDVGDAGMPVIDHTQKVTGWYPNEHFGLHYGEPVIIMLDEMTKGTDPVKNMLQPLLDEFRPRFGNIPVPEGSIIFTAGNLSGEGLGDSRKDHIIGRQTTVLYRKPTGEEWIHDYAVNAGVHGAVISFVRETPQVMASYLDAGQEDNLMIYSPRRPGRPSASPRTLSRVSTIVKQRREMDEDTLRTGINGTIGAAAGEPLMTWIEYQNELPAWKDLIANPRTAHIPSPGALSNLIFGAVQKVTGETIDPFMRYVERLDPTWQATFCIALDKSNNKQIGFRSAAYKEWFLHNQDLL